MLSRNNSLPAILGGAPLYSPNETAFIWPRISAETETAVIGQLHESISIYDRSGIFKEFEDNFAKYHGIEYALLSNSGTSSILAMFEGMCLGPEDEIICSVYTFHATISPAMYLGAKPIFCDIDKSGNISLESIKTKITSKTKAIIVTHMWGIPAQDIEDISKFCEQNDLILLEDCSHAHGASISNKKVGTFGDAAAWSLQGQKTITGGEGGILLTNNRDIYERALLQGHYNKRPKQEISDNEPLRDFYLTGMGLKLRAHPLAIAIADQQFKMLDDFIEVRSYYATLFLEAIKKYPFLEGVSFSPSQPSWYALPILFDEKKAYGITRERFVDALAAEGLIEFDIPGSTGLLNNLPLFTRPGDILPRLYGENYESQSKEIFQNAEDFYKRLIKLPVWSYSDQKAIIEMYIKGIEKIADYIIVNKTL